MTDPMRGGRNGGGRQARSKELTRFGFSMSTFIFLFVVPGVLFLLAIDDLGRRQFSDSGTQVIWALVILFVPILGPLLYLCVG